MEAVVAELLHNNVPVKLLAVSVEVPQLSTTVTVGGGGIAFGVATPEPGLLAHPLTVCETL